MRLSLLAAVMTALMANPAHAQEPLRLFGAGSLREAMTEISQAYTKATQRPVTTAFGFSGLMRERIERGEEADVFTSADMGHPQRLLRDGRASRVVLFARNSLCIVAAPGTQLTEAAVIDRLLDTSLTLGVFPAEKDPVGDYTLELFRKIGEQRPGADAALRARAIVISESMLGRPVAAGEDWAATLLRDGRMRIHVSYCTTARNRLAKEVPGLEIAPLPASLQVGPAYGLAVLRGARAGAEDLALFILGEEAQAILARFGFTPVTRP